MGNPPNFFNVYATLSRPRNQALSASIMCMGGGPPNRLRVQGLYGWRNPVIGEWEKSGENLEIEPQGETDLTFWITMALEPRLQSFTGANF